MANLAHRAVAWGRATGTAWVARLRRMGGGGLARLPASWQSRLRRAARVAVEVRAKSIEDDLGTQAAALTFSAFLSLLPLILLGLSVAGFTASQTQGLGWIEQLQVQIPGLGSFIDAQLETLQSSRASLGLIALGGVAWSASALSVRATTSLGVVFALHPSALAGRVRAVGAMFVLGVLLIITLGANGLAAGIRLSSSPLNGVVQILGFLLLTVVAFLFFLIGYEALTPGGPTGLRDHVPGAILMAVGWQALLTVGVVMIDRTIARSTAVYGAVASLFGVLAFLRLAMSLWLYGAELSSVLFDERRGETARRGGRVSPDGTSP